MAWENPCESGDCHPKDRKISITPEIRNTIRNEIQRTGVRADKFIQIHHNDLPAGLNFSVIHHTIYRSDKKYIETPHYEYLIMAYQNLPTRVPNFTPGYQSNQLLQKAPQLYGDGKPRMVLQGRIQELISERERTGVSVSLLLRSSPPNRPEGINAGVVNSWFTHGPKTAREDYFNYVLKRWRQYPDAE